MLTESVQIYIKNIGLLFHVRISSDSTQCQMADTLVTYISNYEFQFKFNLNIEDCKFQQKIINIVLVIYIQVYIYVFYILSVLRWS